MNVSELEAWAERETLTKSCPCIAHARYWLSYGQRLNEVKGQSGFFALGAALNSIINHVDGKHDPE